MEPVQLTRATPPARRGGFTIVEVIVAIVILSIIASTTARFAGSAVRLTTTNRARVAISAAAQSRIRQIKADPRYTQLGTLYNNVSETGLLGFPNMRRVTTVSPTDTAAAFRTVTVSVWDATQLSDTLRVRTVIASP